MTNINLIVSIRNNILTYKLFSLVNPSFPEFEKLFSFRHSVRLVNETVSLYTPAIDNKITIVSTNLIRFILRRITLYIIRMKVWYTENLCYLREVRVEYYL